MLNTFISEHNTYLTKDDFEKLSRFVYSQCGIKMPPIKKTMLETRLKKRLKATGLSTFPDYIHYLFSSKGLTEELVHMIDVVTTNKTDFFREPAQFTFLAQKALPELAMHFGIGVEKRLKVWSAGCSTGEEPYTLAVVLSEFARSFPKYDYSILATDISTRVLEAAMTGIYDTERIAVIPIELKKKYFLKGKDSQRDKVRVTNELRRQVLFRRLNFMDDDYKLVEKQDIIFCRNVIIYFDKDTQERIIKKLCDLLIPGGYMFLGHSETILKIDIPMEQVAPSTYKKFK
ncbi:MAG: protein-glutamate O-methyltransferase [Ignavibacteriaceae bacterium]